MSSIQYTIRGVPSKVDARLRRIAGLRGKSLNQVVLEQLSYNPEVSKERTAPKKKAKANSDFDNLFGTITPLEPEVEMVLRSQRLVNPKDWQ